MKLTKDEDVYIYEVLTDYKVRVKSSPFIAVLKFAQECQEEYQEEITAEILYNNFLKPLPVKACENILRRLSSMGYFELRRDIVDDNDQTECYALTDMGFEAAQNEEFYDERYGVLRLYLIMKNEFVKQKIIKIEELKDTNLETHDENMLEKINNTKLKEIGLGKIIELETGAYIFRKFEEKCIVVKKAKEKLTFEINQEGSVISILNFKLYLDENIEQIKKELLKNEFSHDYNSEKNIVLTKYDPENLNIKRVVEIKKPTYSKTEFNPITIEKVRVSPLNLNDAKNWYSNLLISRINKHFISDDEFDKFANNIAKEFDLYEEYLKNSITRSELINKMNTPELFYKRSKLETINYLKNININTK